MIVWFFSLWDFWLLRKRLLVFFFIFATPSFGKPHKKSGATYRVSKILELTINSSINPATFNYLKSGYQKAEKEGFDVVLIKMNTLGA